MEQILVIGLGQFGGALARQLTEKGAEVLAVDRREELVEDVAPFVADAVVADATDEEALSRLHPERRDVSVVAIGDDSQEAAILATALLRQMGAPRVIARGGHKLNQRILRLVGAHEVFSPEEEFGRRLASRLAIRGVITDVPLSEEIHITEIEVPESFTGKSLVELELPRRFGVVVAALRRGERGDVELPDPRGSLSAGERLIVVSREDAIAAMLQEA